MDILSKFSDTLHELLILNDYTEKTFSEKSGIPLSCISLYVRGQQAPYISSLIKIADCFHCSIDYLLGRTDNLINKKYNCCPPFSQRIDELLKENELTSYNIYNNSEISKSSFYAWKRGTSLPTLENLVKLADIFNCSVDYILGRES